MSVTIAASQSRMKNPATIIPEAMGPLSSLGQVLGQWKSESGHALSLALMRTSQLNGCAMCLNWRQAKESGESEARLFAVSVWRESTLFTPPERAALALAESMTRLSDRSDPVPDAVWEEAARHFQERELALLVLGVATMNLYNRLNVTTHQVEEPWDAKAAQEWEARNRR